jgi:hypothetical protein
MARYACVVAKPYLPDAKEVEPEDGKAARARAAAKKARVAATIAGNRPKTAANQFDSRLKYWETER